MSFYILITTAYFLIVAFLSDSISGGANNAILSFYNIQIRFVHEHLTVFILVAIAGIIYIFIKKRYGKKGILYYIQNVLVATTVSSFFSLILLFIIAFLQLNLMAILVNVKPRILGVESNPKSIAEKIKDRNSPPHIIIGSEEENSVISAIALAQSGSESFYGVEIIKSVPSFLVLSPGEIDSSTLLVGDTLIVVRANSVEFQSISPVVSYLFIKDFFLDQDIRFFPTVSLMNEEEYQLYRKADFEENVMLLEQVVLDIDESIDDLTNKISEQEDQIFEDEERLEELRSQRESEYIACVNEGYYEEGVYIKTNTKEECAEEGEPLEGEISELRDDIEDVELTISKNKEKLKSYDAYSRYYAGQKSVVDEMTEFISYEFASFTPPGYIQIALFENNRQSVADYFELLVHEYLHYTTFDEDGKRLATDFFREGLTEYFARKIIRRNLGVETNLGYPANVKIIEAMSKRISDADFGDVYFSQDEGELEKLLDLVYDEGFYQRNRVVLETMHYSSSTKNILELGNSVMGEIEGEPLTKDDLKTTYSTFE